MRWPWTQTESDHTCISTIPAGVSTADMEEQVRSAVLCTQGIYDGRLWNIWANNWLSERTRLVWHQPVGIAGWDLVVREEKMEEAAISETQDAIKRAWAPAHAAVERKCERIAADAKEAGMGAHEAARIIDMRRKGVAIREKAAARSASAPAQMANSCVWAARAGRAWIRNDSYHLNGLKIHQTELLEYLQGYLADFDYWASLMEVAE